MLLDMRKQRLGLIQTPDQLRFSYIAILQGAMNSTEDDDSESEEIEEEGKKNNVLGIDKSI